MVRGEDDLIFNQSSHKEDHYRNTIFRMFRRQAFLPYSPNKCKHLLTNNFLEILV
jgi:hypothetical protein